MTAATLGTSFATEAAVFESSTALIALGRLEQRTGLPFLCFHPEEGIRVEAGSPDLPPFLPDSIGGTLRLLDAPAVFQAGGGLVVYAVPLPGGPFVAYGYQLAPGTSPPHELVEASRDIGWSEHRLRSWVNAHPRCSAKPLGALLRLAASEFAVGPSPETQIRQLSEQLDQTYEEISLLHSLSRNLQISRGPAELVTLCLDRIPGLIDAEAHLVQLRPPGENRQIWTSGELPFEFEGIPELLSRLEVQDSSRPIVRNHLTGSPLAAKFPGLRNLVAAPVREGRHRFGWIVSTNLSRGREFGTVEASFLNTIATILGTHVRNIELLHEQNDLLLGFVRSFVSTLDAKDPYTRGHSERVALVARRIGSQMRLPEEELKTIYLSGLLHDVGKIGVDDQILRKSGPLTDDEFAQVKKHPVIGYNILSSLKNLHHVLPGVRSHHESYDGSGYPDGLAGDGIPLLARVLAVADAYDAMGSDRPYRKGMPAHKIEGIFERGRNRQWDGAVLDGYLACRDDVLAICAEYSLEHGREFSETS